jgi:hypothetical protein
MLGIVMPGVCVGLLVLTGIVHASMHCACNGCKCTGSERRRTIYTGDDNSGPCKGRCGITMGNGRPFKKSGYLRSAFGLLLFSYNSVATVVFKFLRCEDITDDTSVIFSAPAIRCESSEYKSMTILIICVLAIVVIGFPLVLLAFLCHAHRNDKLGSTKFAGRIGMLYEAYNAKHYWWESMVLFRRSILIALLSLLDLDRASLFTVLCLGNLVFLVIHLIFAPYRANRDNNLETGFMAMLVVITLRLVASKETLSTSHTFQLFFLVYVPLAVGLCYVIFVLVRKHLCKSAKSDRLEDRPGQAAEGLDDFAVSPLSTITDPDFTLPSYRESVFGAPDGAAGAAGDAVELTERKKSGSVSVRAKSASVLAPPAASSLGGVDDLDADEPSLSVDFDGDDFDAGADLNLDDLGGDGIAASDFGDTGGIGAFEENDFDDVDDEFDAAGLDGFDIDDDAAAAAAAAPSRMADEVMIDAIDLGI